MTLKKFSLPLIIHKHNKSLAGFLFTIFASLVYLLSNHYHLKNPQLLSLSWIDQSIPFIPWSIWIYLSEYFLFITVYLICKNIINLNKYLYSFFTLQLTCVIIFILFPTTYPREQFPLPLDLEANTYFVFQMLRTADTPANCCPSLHVSCVYLSAFVFLNEQKEKFPLFFIWATAIAISTLTTKQHYMIDVLTGILMTCIMYWIFHHWIQYKPLKTRSIAS